MADTESGRERPRLAVAVSALIAWSLAALVVALLLSDLLLLTNGSEGGIAQAGAVFVATLWIAGVMNAGFLGVGLALWPFVAGRLDRASRRGRIAYFSSGLLALNLAWILWNRLQMAHQPLSRRPFLTTTGAVEIAGIGLATLLIWFGGAGLVGSRRAAARLAAVGSGLAIAALLTLLDAREAAWQRIYSHREIAAAVGEPSATAVAARELEDGAAVILIGVDGLSWGTLQPLLRNGKLPAFAKLLSRGSFGYLENGEQSFSPPIWTTIFTGQAKEIHGIHGYRKWIPALSGRSVPNLRTVSDAFDVFYGLNHLIQRLPSAGLWRVEFASSRDRRVPTLWEVAGSRGKRVAVVDPIVGTPFGPVNGAIVDLTESWESGSASFQPEALARRWGREPVSASIPRGDAEFERLADRLSEEVGFAIELFRDQQADLAIFYTHFIDTVSHFNWDFYARGEFFLGDLPRNLDPADWERTVLDHASDRVFRCYRVFDRQLGRLLRAFPNATFVLVSDHGWTYSGYEHFGSPDGVIAISGPSVRREAEIRDASIEDVAPTIYALLGVPLSREFAGRPLSEAFSADFAVEWVDAYDASLIAPPSAIGRVVDDPEAERLRAIGYID